MACRLFPLLVFAVLAGARLVRAATAAEAEELYRAKRYAEAKIAYEQIIAAAPDNADAAYHLGDLALMREAPDEAARWLEKATALAPKSSLYFRELGDAYGISAEKAGLFSKLSFALKCQAAYEHAVALDPADVEARYSLFTFYRQAPSIAGGGLDKARAQALEIQKRDDERGTLALVELNVAEHKFDEAFAALDGVRRRHPDSLVANYQFGRTAAMSGQRLDQGAAALRRYLAATPDEDQPPLWAAHWRLGQILEKMGDAPGARAEYAAGLKLNPTQPQLVEAAQRLLK
jgi:tetratricopeptide (TPR) repeat protein